MPQALPVIMVAATVASTAIGVGSSMQQASMAQTAANHQANMGNIQGELAELNARSEAAEIQNEATRLKGRQIAQASSAGVTLDSGSFMTIVADSANKANADREQVLRAGRLNRAAAEAGASAYSYAGSMKSSASMSKAGSTLFSGLDSATKIGEKAGWFN